MSNTKEALKIAREEIAGLNGDPNYSERFDGVLEKIDEALAEPEPESVGEVSAGSYLENHEMQQLEFLLSHALKNTLSCWKATRLKGSSASMACDGNVSIPLLRAFDEVADKIRAMKGTK